MKHALKLSAISIAALSGAIMIFSVAPSAAANLEVTNDGADSATCGPQTNPCRSISQAIENASDGDAIEVGAGHYGNVSGDPNFAGPGDEHPSMTGETHGCIICVTKAVHIFSIHGAAVTIIQGSATTPFRSNVMILHDGVIFGRAGGGFTITGGNDTGLAINVPPTDGPFLSVVRNITVADNVDVNDGTGFYFIGITRQQIIGCPPAECPQTTAQILFSDNEAIGNQVGFNLTVNVDLGPGQLIVRNNMTVGAGTGFAAIPGGCGVCDTINAPASIVQFVDNVAANGGVGFSANLSGLIEGNTASGNSLAGFIVTPGYTQIFQSNSAIGNGGPGVIVNFSPDPFTLQVTAFASFSNNNFYGNDRNRPVFSLFGFDHPGPGANCGVFNAGALAAQTPGGVVSPPPVIKLQAGNNFWGSASGPQSNGPGDAVGGVCDQNGGVTLARPYATIPFGITSWP